MGIDAVLIIAGSGIGTDYQTEILELSRTLNIKDKIIYAGFRNDVGDLLNTCDALIHTSMEESFGFAVLEAMWAGKPIFAADIPAVNEVATNKVAYLFTPGNNEELTELLKNWLDKKESSLGRVKAGLERYKKYFTFSTMMREYERYYEE
jgi:glycosyltransferase involved in cell wall biosynthesis